MPDTISGSMVGYITAYILCKKATDRTVWKVWFNAFYGFNCKIQHDWGW